MEDGVSEAESIMHLQEEEKYNHQEQQQEENSDLDNYNGNIDDKDLVEENSFTGGLLNQIVSSFVSKVEAAAGDNDEDSNKKEDQEKHGDKSEEKKEGGILDNLISHLVSPTPKHEESVEEELSEKGNGHKVKTEEEEGAGGGGGIIDNIVSHFPTSLSDDAVPTTDEASILIHSIVHD